MYHARRFVPPDPDLDKLKEAAAGCTACPLHERGTQTVFGEGRVRSRVMATVHPSSLLRIEDDAERKDAIRHFVRELRQVAAVLGNGSAPEQE